MWKTIFFDFAKDFDNVVYDRICHKLRDLSINGKFGEQFLKDRSQAVQANGAT